MVSDHFADCFVSGVHVIKHRCNPLLSPVDDLVIPNVSFYMSQVIVQKVNTLISSLSSRKSPGIDLLRVSDFKFVNNEVSHVIKFY